MPDPNAGPPCMEHNRLFFRIVPKDLNIHPITLFWDDRLDYGVEYGTYLAQSAFDRLMKLMRGQLHGLR